MPQKIGPRNEPEAVVSLEQGNLAMSNPPLQVVSDNLATKPEIPNPFDLAKLRLNPSFTETVGVRKLRTTVPVRKPSPQDFIRVNPNPAYRDNFAMIELKDEREEYLVSPKIASLLPGEIVLKTIYTAINRQGVVFLWPVGLPSADDKPNAWWNSAREAAEMAMTKWLRMRANMSLGAYEITVAESEIPDPEWSKVEESFQDLLQLAFELRLVTDLDHAVIKRLHDAPKC
jgi:hypothetical protein